MPNHFQLCILSLNVSDTGSRKTTQHMWPSLCPLASSVPHLCLGSCDAHSLPSSQDWNEVCSALQKSFDQVHSFSCGSFANQKHLECSDLTLPSSALLMSYFCIWSCRDGSLARLPAEGGYSARGDGVLDPVLILWGRGLSTCGGSPAGWQSPWSSL